MTPRELNRCPGHAEKTAKPELTELTQDESRRGSFLDLRANSLKKHALDEPYMLRICRDP